MKVTQINITDFHQFKSLTIDLTYPKGHKKEGQPLDKVCFIGQSGTGKTTLLELIPKILFGYDTKVVMNSGMEAICGHVKMSFVVGANNEFFYNNVTYRKNRNSKTLGEYEWLSDVTEQDNDQRIVFSDEWNYNIETKLIYFPANLNYDIEIENDIDLKNRRIFDFNKEQISSVWNLILEEIRLYQEKEIQIRLEMAKTVEQASNNMDIIEKSFQKLKDWKRTEFNPVQDIADNCLNKLLLPFKLRVKTDLEFKKKDDIGFIKIEDFEGNEIPHDLWSTGTKQVVLSAMPLYLIKPKQTIILFDEPERSLYPDMQRFIVDYYSSLTDNSQFFYATHSPIIASSFEPWEIVELKFNKDGKVYREQYYEGENHVDNYKWNPMHMRWDDILLRVFDMESDGSPERKKLLDELGKNNVKYRKLSEKGLKESEEGKQLLNRIMYLRTELSYWKYAEN